MSNEIRALRKLANRTQAQQQKFDQRIKDTTQQVKVKLNDDKWHRRWVQIAGSKMMVKLDGKLIGELDSPGINHPTRDKFGLTVVGKAIEFDDWKVSLPTDE